MSAELRMATASACTATSTQSPPLQKLLHRHRSLSGLAVAITSPMLPRVLPCGLRSRDAKHEDQILVKWQAAPQVTGGLEGRADTNEAGPCAGPALVGRNGGRT